MSHTPGPWTCTSRDGGVSQYVEGNGVTVAKVGDYDSTDWEADARLIAAAPDLLRAAVESVYALFEGPNAPVNLPTDQNDAIQLLRAAIAKATGAEVSA